MEWILGLTLSWTLLALFVCMLCAAARRIDDELALDAVIAIDVSLD